jgi:hypothetical protein
VSGAIPVDEESYLDQRAHQEIKTHGVASLAGLDDFDRSKLVDRSLARLAKRQKITAGRPLPPYVGRQLKRIVTRAAAPDPNERFESAAAFIGALTELALPNWLLVDGLYRAKEWKGRDWTVDPNPVPHPKRGTEYEIRKGKPGQKDRHHAYAVSLKSAFDEIEQWGST